MRKSLKTLVLTLSMSAAFAGAAYADGYACLSGTSTLETMVMSYYDTANTVCTAEDSDFLQCDKALRDFASLTNVDAAALLPEVAAMSPDVRAAFLDEVSAYSADPKCSESLRTRQDNLYVQISSANQDNKLFMYGIDDALMLCTGYSYTFDRRPRDPSPVMPS